MDKEEFVKNMIRWHIASEKYLLSQHWSNTPGKTPFCPVTVPQTVDYCLTRSQQNEQEGYEGMFQDPDFILGKLRLDLILGYFSHKTQEPLIWMHGSRHHYESPEKTSRLEGELRRFGADIYEKNPSDVNLTTNLVGLYCHRNLITPLENKLKSELNLPF